MLSTRGYSTTSFLSLNTAYYSKPTSAQLSSYGVALTEAIQMIGVSRLRQLLDVGLSPNACNAHGESVVHMACRMGKKGCLQVLLDYGCSIQVSDDYGRTPLHSACLCREANFEIVDMLLERDARLVSIEDNRRVLPLSYLRSEQWTAWTKYLMSRKKKYWPERDIVKQGVQPDPPLTLHGPNTNTIPEPKDPLPQELVRMVANGRMQPMEAVLLKDDLHVDSSTASESICDDYSDSFDLTDDNDEDDFSSSSDQSELSTTFDEKEMQEILCCLGKGQAIAWSS